MSEGGADPPASELPSTFDALAAIRASSDLAGDPGAIDHLAEAASHWPPGQERTEARLLCAEAYAGRFRRLPLALALERSVASDPSADLPSRTLAARTLVDAEIDRGDLPAARADAGTYALFLDARSLGKLRTAVRRQAWTSCAEVELGLALGLALLPLLRRVRRPPSLSLVFIWSNVRRRVMGALVFGAFVAGAGGALAYAFDGSDPRPFFGLGAAVAIIASLAQIQKVLAGASTAPIRTLRALVAAASVVAAAFLLVEWIDASYLAGFGL